LVSRTATALGRNATSTHPSPLPPLKLLVNQRELVVAHDLYFGRAQVPASRRTSASESAGAIAPDSTRSNASLALG
jgi:hypothetical protein